MMTYKCIDVEGFKKENTFINSRLVSDFLGGTVAKGTLNEEGDLIVPPSSNYIGSNYISSEELEDYFELVPLLWDGKAPLEVDMIVEESSGVKVSVVLIEGTQVVTRGDNGQLFTTYIENLSPATTSHKEATESMYLEACKEKGLHYTDKNLTDCFNVLYDLMKEE